MRIEDPFFFNFTRAQEPMTCLIGNPHQLVAGKILVNGGVIIVVLRVQLIVEFYLAIF